MGWGGKGHRAAICPAAAHLRSSSVQTFSFPTQPLFIYHIYNSKVWLAFTLFPLALPAIPAATEAIRVAAMLTGRHQLEAGNWQRSTSFCNKTLGRSARTARPESPAVSSSHWVLGNLLEPGSGKF